MSVELSYGRTLACRSPGSRASSRQAPSIRERVEIGHFGLHWEHLDEDISIAGLLAGRGDMTKRAEPAA